MELLELVYSCPGHFLEGIRTRNQIQESLLTVTDFMLEDQPHRASQALVLVELYIHMTMYSVFVSIPRDISLVGQSWIVISSGIQDCTSYEACSSNCTVKLTGLAN